MKLKRIAVATTKSSELHGHSHALVCCMCGERDFSKLLVQDIGIALGMNGDDFTFCKTCWNHPRLGRKLLRLLGHPKGLILLPARYTLHREWVRP